MKRYVQEFADDEIKAYKRTIEIYPNTTSAEICKKSIEKIQKVVNACKYGNISDFEAVKIIANMNGGLNREQSNEKNV